VQKNENSSHTGNDVCFLMQNRLAIQDNEANGDDKFRTVDRALRELESTQEVVQVLTNL
jgi:hypothetical protein